MEAGKTVTVSFGPEESQLYDLMEQQCLKKGLAAADYIKSLIKVDLAWGHFRRPKKEGERK